MNKVKHIKGKDNLITDYLSRKPLVLNTTIIPPDRKSVV